MGHITAHFRRSIGVWLALAGLAFALPAQADYVFRILDTPWGVDFANEGFVVTYGLNEHGQVSGYTWIGPTATNTTSFIYDVGKDSYTALPSYQDTETDANAINNAGVVVGGRYNADYSAEFGFILRGGSFTFVSHPAPLYNTEFRGISSTGLITGYAYDAAGYQFTDFVYDPKTNRFTDFMPSVCDQNCALSITSGINAHGDVVGSAFYDADVLCSGCPAKIYGFVRTAEGQVTLFLVNSKGTRPRGISDSGLIAGMVGPGLMFVTKLAPGPGYQPLTIPQSMLYGIPGAVWTWPMGITNSGMIAGLVIYDNGAEHGFVALPKNH